jgi:hypothetical protein
LLIWWPVLYAAEGAVAMMIKPDPAAKAAQGESLSLL